MPSNNFSGMFISLISYGGLENSSTVSFIGIQNNIIQFIRSIKEDSSQNPKVTNGTIQNGKLILNLAETQDWGGSAIGLVVGRN